MAEPSLTVLFTQRVGAVDRIMSLLRRRGFPISGMTFERTHRPQVGRMTIVVKEPKAVDQVSRHLSRLPDVLEVTRGDEDALQREYALLRIGCTPQQRPEVLALLSAFDARVLSSSADHLVVEATGDAARLDALFVELVPYGIEEAARTSPISMRRVPPSEQEMVDGSLQSRSA